MADDFCIEHGYDYMKTQRGNPVPFCEACERDQEATNETLLSPEQILGLADGTRVVVTWSGGNGPCHYWTKRSSDGSILACVDALPPGYPGVLCQPGDKVAIHRVEIDTAAPPQRS